MQLNQNKQDATKNVILALQTKEFFYMYVHCYKNYTRGFHGT